MPSQNLAQFSPGTPKISPGHIKIRRAKNAQLGNVVIAMHCNLRPPDDINIKAIAECVNSES